MSHTPIGDFEDLRSHLAAQYRLTISEPWLLAFERDTVPGRKQNVFIAEIDSEDGRHLLRISSPIRPMDGIDPMRCLSFNWQQRLGFLAVGDLDGQDYLHLCENRPYRGLSAEELDYLVGEIAVLADSIEAGLGGPDTA